LKLEKIKNFVPAKAFVDQAFALGRDGASVHVASNGSLEFLIAFIVEDALMLQHAIISG